VTALLHPGDRVAVDNRPGEVVTYRIVADVQLVRVRLDAGGEIQVAARRCVPIASSPSPDSSKAA
jgi:hypothetical protein